MSSAIDVTIMGQPYLLACNEGEEIALKQAVAYLDVRMCAIRDSGKIKGTDRIAVMAALGMSAEFLAARTAPVGSASSLASAQTEVRSQITAMHALLDSALAPQEKLF